MIIINQEYIYAVRNKTTNKLCNAKCGKTGKLYEMKGYADRRCKEFNDKGYDMCCNKGEFEVVTFELKEIN